jgi:hypothetical protein
MIANIAQVRLTPPPLSLPLPLPLPGSLQDVAEVLSGDRPEIKARSFYIHTYIPVREKFLEQKFSEQGSFQACSHEQ